MKYIITESRYSEFIKNYLDNFLESKDVSRVFPYILISEPYQTDDEDTWVDYMEYDTTNGRLWVNDSFLNNIAGLFFDDVDVALLFIKEWFENKFNVEVKIL